MCRNRFNFRKVSTSRILHMRRRFAVSNVFHCRFRIIRTFRLGRCALLFRGFFYLFFRRYVTTCFRSLCPSCGLWRGCFCAFWRCIWLCACACDSSILCASATFWASAASRASSSLRAFSAIAFSAFQYFMITLLFFVIIFSFCYWLFFLEILWESQWNHPLWYWMIEV
mgnify:CR=1 FL=1